MSRFTLFNGKTEYVYGFDHAVGPFYQEWDHNQEPFDALQVNVCYAFQPNFDCHALAAQLQGLVDQGTVRKGARLSYHINRLFMDLTI